MFDSSYFDEKKELPLFQFVFEIELRNFKKLLKDLVLICPLFIKNGKKYRDIYIEIIEDFKYQLKNQ